MQISDYSLWSELLTGSQQGWHTWTIIREAPASDYPGKGRVLNGSLEEVKSELDEAQRRGCGIFATVNETDGRGKFKENIVRVRAVFCDVDSGIWIDPPLPPTMVVKTKSGWHIYFVLRDTCSIETAEDLNRRIAAKLGGDTRAVDASRVLRVPGFFHLKSEPFLIQIESANKGRYSVAELSSAFPPSAFKRTITAGEAREAGEDTNYGLAACSAEYEEVANTTVGGRNYALCKSAFKLGTLVGGGELTKSSAVEYLLKAAKENGYWQEEGEGHTRRVIESSIKKGMEHPRNASRGESTVLTPASIPGSTIYERWAGVETELRRRLEKGFEPFPSPIAGLNSVLGGGAAPGGITLICAAPGAGKSSFCMQWAEYVARKGRDVIYSSLELSLVDICTRVCLSKNTMSWLEARCGAGVEQMSEIMSKQYSGLPLHLFDRRECASVAHLQQVVEGVSKKSGRPPLLFLDYLQLLAIGKSDDEIRGAISQASSDLRVLAQDTGAAVVCVSAVSRAAYNIIDKRTTKPDRNAVLASAKESGGTEYDAEAVIGIHIFHGTDCGWMSVAKNRSGGPCCDIPIRFDGARGLFGDASEDEVYLAYRLSQETEKGGKND